MSIDPPAHLETLLAGTLGAEAGTAGLARLATDARLAGERGGAVSRATFAMALNVTLFADLLARVPSGAAYVEQVVAGGGRVCLDHGALRTIRFAAGPTGALPAGESAFSRLLEPLGYRMAALYPLPALKMTGRAYCHRDLPAAIPQFFVSELHVEAFDADYDAVAKRVFGTSRDPVPAEALATLAAFARDGSVPLAQAMTALPAVAAAFGRHHDPCSLADYEALRAQSAEAAWIATEGNAFNHATDRVDDVAALAVRLRTAGWPIKDKVEVSASGRVRQTALLADPVERVFAGGERRSVPGSFYEFISRAVDPATGALDLGFDSGNATGIFAMTRPA
ncbi:MAG: hypothetical protein JWM75_2901 [Sphingomonas bacterium]|nr:hypothetical protein [Sphingomonas bacterium]